MTRVKRKVNRTSSIVYFSTGHFHRLRQKVCKADISFGPIDILIFVCVFNLVSFGIGIGFGIDIGIGIGIGFSYSIDFDFDFDFGFGMLFI